MVCSLIDLTIYKYYWQSAKVVELLEKEPKTREYVRDYHMRVFSMGVYLSFSLFTRTMSSVFFIKRNKSI